MNEPRCDICSRVTTDLDRAGGAFSPCNLCTRPIPFSRIAYEAALRQRRSEDLGKLTLWQRFRVWLWWGKS